MVGKSRDVLEKSHLVVVRKSYDVLEKSRDYGREVKRSSGEVKWLW